METCGLPGQLEPLVESGLTRNMDSLDPLVLGVGDLVHGHHVEVMDSHPGNL